MKHMLKKHRGKSIMLIKFGLTTLITYSFSIYAATAQTMYVRQNNGAQTNYPLSEVRKITFAPAGIIITKNDNSSLLFALSAVRYISFSDYITGVRPLLKENATIHVYPNPVSSVLNIALPGPGIVRILTIDGKVMISGQVNTAGITPLSVEQLPKGIYLCHYTNVTESKTVKIIKQ